MENSVGTLFFSASLFLLPRKARKLSRSEVSSTSASGGKDTSCFFLPIFRGWNWPHGILSNSKFSTFYALSKIWRFTMAFNKGYELKKFEAHWEKLRIEYAAAGMAGDAIQKMYDYDRQQFNSERTCIERTQEFTAPAYESSEEEASPLMLRYQEAITTTDTYHETKRSFAWIGEIENERLLSALETLSDLDLKILTLYAYDGYTESEIARALESKRITIHKRIERITMFLKKF
jgi:hypothetical protein